MIVITNGTEYIYLDEEHQIQKTTDLTKAKTFTFQGCSIFIRENVKATKGFYAYDTETQRICYRRKKKKSFPKTTRMMIYNQADGRCVLCGRKGHDNRPYQTYFIRWIRFSGKSSVHMSNMQHLQRQDAPGHIF